jgi:hypothetical protein
MRISDLIPEPRALVQSDYFTRKNRLVQYESGKGVALSTVLAGAKAPRDEVNWDYATLERTDMPGVIHAAGGATTVWVDFPAQKSVAMPAWFKEIIS